MGLARSSGGRFASQPGTSQAVDEAESDADDGVAEEAGKCQGRGRRGRQMEKALENAQLFISAAIVPSSHAGDFVIRTAQNTPLFNVYCELTHKSIRIRLRHIEEIAHSVSARNGDQLTDMPHQRPRWRRR